ncbi:Clavaminate synthase [Lecanosticta acicola]|uniref:Clavaminate synthase n=1 Tax=Lecanosticta acicola TaxID=111012 RepID=A0AAI8YV11_9PEZI|nr:Clavaminate synthase [Lecanosticta acicola]
MSPPPSQHRVSQSTADIEPHMKTDHHVHKVDLGHATSGVTLSPELFEKLYLQPKMTQYARFANPTPMGLVGFVISTFTFSMVLMGWGGASGFPAVVGIFFFVGPLMLTLAAIFNWIMGNFYPMMATSLFAVFWLSFGMLQLPSLGLAAYYSPDGTNATEGASSAGYNTVIGLYLVVWGFAFLTYLIFAMKTNVVFAAIFFYAAVAVWVLAGAYFKTATGDYTTAGHCQTAAGALLFVVSVLGWWIVVAMMAAEMRIGINIPIGDLSHFWNDTKSAEKVSDVEKQE